MSDVKCPGCGHPLALSDRQVDYAICGCIRCGAVCRVVPGASVTRINIKPRRHAFGSDVGHRLFRIDVTHAPGSYRDSIGGGVLRYERPVVNKTRVVLFLLAFGCVWIGFPLYGLRETLARTNDLAPILILSLFLLIGIGIFASAAMTGGRRAAWLQVRGGTLEWQEGFARKKSLSVHLIERLGSVHKDDNAYLVLFLRDGRKRYLMRGLSGPADVDLLAAELEAFLWPSVSDS